MQIWRGLARRSRRRTHRRGLREAGFPSRFQRGRNRAPRLESLEARRLLALVVTEINYNPLPPLAIETQINPDLDNDEFEFIEFWNSGGQTLNLANYRITEGVRFNFPNMMLAPEQYVVVVKNIAAFNARYGWRAGINVAGQFIDGSLDNGGEQLQILNAVGAVIADFEYNDGADWPGRADGNGSSLEIVDPTLANDYNDPDSYRSSRDFHGSPGRAGGRDEDIVINEVLAHTDPPLYDAIELHNTTTAPIDIGYWYLSDGFVAEGQLDADAYFKYRIPADTIVPAGGYVVFRENLHFNVPPPDPKDFGLDSARGDDVRLVAADQENHPLRFVHDVSFPGSLNGDSFGLWRPPPPPAVPPAPDPCWPVSNELYVMTGRTFGARNSGPRVGPLLISEIMYNPADPGTGTDPGMLEFIEIYNSSATSVNLNQWQIRDGVVYAFPVGTTLAAHSALIVVPFDPADSANQQLLTEFRNTYSIGASVQMLGPYEGALANDGEEVWLARPDEPPAEEPGFYPLTVEDQVDYDDDEPWPLPADGMGFSLTRLGATLWGDSPCNWSANIPTPGSVAVARDDTRANGAETLEDTAVTINVLANDGLDAYSQNLLTITSTGETSDGGQVEIVEQNRRIRYTPAPDFHGEETFTYTVFDGGTGMSQATVTVRVNPVNDPPTANADAFEVNEDSMNVELDVLANDVDVDEGDTLSILGTTSPSQGGAVSVNGGRLLYTPRADFFGVETFQYSVSDGTLSTQGTVTVQVNNVNDPPTAGDDSFTVDEDQVGNLLDVLLNDSIDPDVGETLSVHSVSSPDQGGSVSVEPDGRLRYSPAPDFYGTETFTYVVTDGTPQSLSEATVTIEVLPQNDDPTAEDDHYVVPEGSAASNLNVLDNDTFAPDMDETLTVLSVSPGGSQGTIEVSPDSLSVLYQPAQDFTGTDTFTYTVTDGNGGTDQATVTVEVTMATTAVGDAFTIDEDTVDNELSVLTNDSVAPGGGELSIVDVGQPDQGGQVSIDGDVLRYTPAADFFGTESFTYTISDDSGAMSSATVTVTVQNQPDPMTAGDDSFEVDEDSQGNELDVLANDSTLPDPPQALEIVEVGTGSAGGTVEIDGAVLRYTPAADFDGVETFQYTVRDTDGFTDQATVTVTVRNVGPTSWQNESNPMDVDANGLVIPLDVLLVINDINANGVRPLPVPPVAPDVPPPFVDVDGNGSLEPRDALIVINFLNDLVGGEGEAALSSLFVGASDVDPAGRSTVDEPADDEVPVESALRLVDLTPARTDPADGHTLIDRLAWDRRGYSEDPDGKALLAVLEELDEPLNPRSASM